MTAPRRILYVDHTATMAGGEIALLHLVRQLDANRFTPIVALLSDGPLAAELKACNVETHILPAGRALIEARKDSLGGNSLQKITAACSSVARLAALMDKSKIDLVHANSLKADLLAGLAARLMRRPVIWHVRDRIESDYLSASATHLFRLLAKILPTYIVANSRATLETVHLINPESGSVIHSGLDLDPYLAVPARPSTAIPRIGIVGRIAPWKGQHVFLQAAALVRQKFPAARFQIVGGPLFSETQYDAELRQTAQSLGLDVEFTGQRSDVPQLLAAMDLVVHASVTPEPFGQVAVLALAAARPLVATAGGGILEIVQDGVSGLLVPMNDAPAMAAAITRLLADPELAARLARQGRARSAELFSIQRTAGQMMDLYDRLLTK
jgi:glycosyltransferase involved in cell wall biosynthesis